MLQNEQLIVVFIGGLRVNIELGLLFRAQMHQLDDVVNPESAL